MLQRSITALVARSRWFCSSVTSQRDPPAAPRRRGMPTTREEADAAALFLRPDSPPDSRLLKVGMLGLPGVGKSTLVNRLAMFQACAASQKINTTRSKQNVVFTKGNTQLVFLDLPGVMSKAKARRHNVARSIIRDPHAGIFQSDMICVVVDVSNPYMRKQLDKEILKALHFFADKPTVLVLTKADKLGKRRHHLLDATRLLSDGVVAGRVCHRDKYQHRFRRRPLEGGLQLLTADSKAEELPAHDGKTDEEILRELEEHEEMNLNERTEEEAVGPDDVGDAEEAVDRMLMNDDAAGDTIETQIDAFFDAEVSRPRVDVGPPVARRRQVDPVLALLREQMLMQSASREDVANRVRRWHRLDEVVRGRVAWPNFQEVFMVSAASGRGVENMRDYLLSMAKPGKWAYHSSLVSDQDPHDTVCLAVQAHCLNLLAKEVPYSVSVEVTDYDKAEDDTIHVQATIFCRTERHMKIVLGIGGDTIAKIASAATTDLQNSFQTNVSLRLAVKRATIPKRHLRFIKKSKDFRKSFPMLNL